MISIAYRVNAKSICGLIPEILEIEAEPLVTTRFIYYGSSSVGPYSELVQQVEVTYRAEKFDYNLFLILDNEAAIFLGRERFGFPKVFGKVDIQQSNANGSVYGGAERPVGNSVVNFEFIPKKLVPTPTAPRKWMLNQRCIPSPFPGEPPSIRELIPATMDMEFSELMLGVGHIEFLQKSIANPWVNLEILRYETASMVTKATAKLCAREKN